MNITQLNSSALKTTGSGKEILLNEVLGRFHQYFTQRHSIRMGWNNSNISYNERKLKEKDRANVFENEEEQQRFSAT
jgi:hypothetical protein